MTGVSEEEYRDMMVAGGRSPDGNRYLHEWEERSGEDRGGQAGAGEDGDR